VRHPRQACHHHAQGHPACPPYPWRACLSSRPPLPSEPIGLFQGHQTKQKEILYSCHPGFQCFRIHSSNLARAHRVQNRQRFTWKKWQCPTHFANLGESKYFLSDTFIFEIRTQQFLASIFIPIGEADRKPCSNWKVHVLGLITFGTLFLVKAHDHDLILHWQQSLLLSCIRFRCNLEELNGSCQFSALLSRDQAFVDRFVTINANWNETDCSLLEGIPS